MGQKRILQANSYRIPRRRRKAWRSKENRSKDEEVKSRFKLRKGKLTGEETIKETTQKIEEELENLDLNPNKEEEETPNFCTELGDFYNKKETTEEQDENENYPEVYHL